MARPDDVHGLRCLGSMLHAVAAKLSPPQRPNLANEKFTDAFERELVRREFVTRGWQ